MPEIENRLPAGQEPIDFLRPDSPQHAIVLEHVLARIKYSERRMQSFYSRWQMNELLLQAYISLPDYDQLLQKVRDDKSGPAVPVAINVPFAWATVNTIVTYLLHMFAGRNPMFTVGSYRPEQVVRAKNMEMLLQYNADYIKFIRNLYFFLMDGETYGVAALRTMWEERTKKRKIIMPVEPAMAALMASMGQTVTGERKTESYVAFQGNGVANIDPFMFFPDPRVPMHEVSEKGEFTFWRAYEGKHILLTEEAMGKLKWVKQAKSTPSRNEQLGESKRAVRSLGSSSPGGWQDSREGMNIAPNYQVDQGTILIIPKDLGLGDGTIPEMWLFTILNENQIVQAMPITTPSGRHPVVVAEPNSVGYSFGQLGTVDMLGPLQQQMSWFMTSHIYNVRSALNNMFVVDPTKVEMQDFANPEPGKLIRLKNTAFGLADPKTAVFQLPVADVTRSHISDSQVFGRMASDLTGATDNARGLQDAGGRKTATEIRTSSEAGTSRLAAKGKIYSAMALTGMAEEWALNYQENLTEEFELNVLGQEAQANSVRITSDSISGDFFFPVHDGTMPMDKIGLLDSWKEIFQAVLADPELRQTHDVVGMFDWICQLGGAQNIQSFKLNVVSNPMQQGMIGSGAGIPMDAALAGIQGSL